MEQEEPKVKQYVIYEDTLENTLTKIESQDQTVLYEYETKKKELTKEQEYIQRDNSWRARQSQSVNVSQYDLKNITEKITDETFMSGYDGDIVKKVSEDILSKKVIVFVTVGEGSVSIITDVGEKENRNYVYDTEELADKLDNLKLDASFYRHEAEKPKVNFELLKLTIGGMYYYRKQDFVNKIPKMAKAFIRSKYVYCTKNGKNIVPKEYLDKGEKGIAEWQELKKSSNKNNSIEKRLIIQTVREKRNFAFACAREVECKIGSVGSSWSIPRLTVDGCWNAGKNTKLVSELFNTKDKNAMMTIEDEKILEEVKGHWKNQLEKAIETIGLLKLEDIRR